MPSLPDALHALALVGIAELGDKSQLVCLALATRYRAAPVLTGALLAFGTLNALAVLLGAVASTLVPTALVKGVAGVVMVVFAVLTWRADDADVEPVQAGEGHPVVVTALMLGLAELGDKTQLTVATLATVADPLSTWVGATLALGATSALAAGVGGPLLHRLPTSTLRWAAAALFLASGVLLLLAAVTS